jgi:nitrogen regulatory protein PII
MFLIVLIVNDPHQCKRLINTWKEIGVPGATIIESLGLQQALKGVVRDNLPLLPTLRDIESGEESRNRTMFSVVRDKETVDRVRMATEALLGSLEAEDTGFMFVVPVSEVFGLWPE